MLPVISSWVEAHVQISIDAADRRQFVIDMTLHGEDEYNFNPGGKDIETGIPDSDNGRFELTDLGKEFHNVSTLKRKLTFSEDASFEARYAQCGPSGPEDHGDAVTMGIHRALFLVFLLASCRAQPIAPPPVRTDVAGLRKLIALPPQTGEVRWVLYEHVNDDGCSGVPGPSDTSIMARVSLDDAGWTDLMARTSASDASDASDAKTKLVLGEAKAEILFDPAQLAKLPRREDERIIEGAKIDIKRVTKGVYNGEAVRWGDQLVLYIGTS